MNSERGLAWDRGASITETWLRGGRTGRPTFWGVDAICEMKGGGTLENNMAELRVAKCRSP